MNCDLWRSHARIFVFIVLVGRNFVAGIYKLKSKKAKKN